MSSFGSRILEIAAPVGTFFYFRNNEIKLPASDALPLACLGLVLLSVGFGAILSSGLKVRWSHLNRFLPGFANRSELILAASAVAIAAAFGVWQNPAASTGNFSGRLMEFGCKVPIGEAPLHVPGNTARQPSTLEDGTFELSGVSSDVQFVEAEVAGVTYQLRRGKSPYCVVPVERTAGIPEWKPATILEVSRASVVPDDSEGNLFQKEGFPWIASYRVTVLAPLPNERETPPLSLRFAVKSSRGGHVRIWDVIPIGNSPFQAEPIDAPLPGPLEEWRTSIQSDAARGVTAPREARGAPSASALAYDGYLAKRLVASDGYSVTRATRMPLIFEVRTPVSTRDEKSLAALSLDIDCSWNPTPLP